MYACDTSRKSSTGLALGPRLGPLEISGFWWWARYEPGLNFSKSFPNEFQIWALVHPHRAALGPAGEDLDALHRAHRLDEGPSSRLLASIRSSLRRRIR